MPTKKYTKAQRRKVLRSSAQGSVFSSNHFGTYIAGNMRKQRQREVPRAEIFKAIIFLESWKPKVSRAPTNSRVHIWSKFVLQWRL